MVRKSRKKKPVIRVRECEVVYRIRNCSAPTRQLTDSKAVHALLRGLGAHERATESLWAVLVDARKQLVAVHECARGSIGGVPVAIADVFRAAIIVGACGIVIAHNHPSGEPDPSPEDLVFTRLVRRAGGLLGVSVLDHVIVGRTRYISLLDTGQWPELPKNKD